MRSEPSRLIGMENVNDKKEDTFEYKTGSPKGFACLVQGLLFRVHTYIYIWIDG